MIRSKLICVILIDLVAESAAVGERGKDFVLVRWAEGVWSALGPVRRDVLRPGIRGPMEIRAVLVAARAIGPVARSPRARLFAQRVAENAPSRVMQWMALFSSDRERFSAARSDIREHHTAGRHTRQARLPPLTVGMVRCQAVPHLRVAAAALSAHSDRSIKILLPPRDRGAPNGIFS